MLKYDLYFIRSDDTEKDIHKLAEHTLGALVQKWKTIFSDDLVESNIRLLKDHVRTFFNEILSETDKKEETILKRIESKQSGKLNQYTIYLFFKK